MKQIHKEQINGYRLQVWEDIPPQPQPSYEVVIINEQASCYQLFTLPSLQMAFEKVSELKKDIQQ
jgi:hypothetical protein